MSLQSGPVASFFHPLCSFPLRRPSCIWVVPAGLFAESRSLLCITPAVLDSTQPPLGLTKTLPVFPPFSLSRPSSSPYLQPLHQVLDTRPPLRTIFPHTLHDKFLV